MDSVYGATAAITTSTCYNLVPVFLPCQVMVLINTPHNGAYPILQMLDIHYNLSYIYAYIYYTNVPGKTTFVGFWRTCSFPLELQYSVKQLLAIRLAFMIMITQHHKQLR